VPPADLSTSLLKAGEKEGTLSEEAKTGNLVLFCWGGSSDPMGKDGGESVNEGGEERGLYLM